MDSANHFPLGSTPKESADPFIHMPLNAVSMKLPQKFAVVDLIEGLRNVQ